MKIKDNKNNKSTLCGAVFFVLLIAVTFFLIFKNTEPENIKSVILHVSPVSIILGLICMIICVACEGECVRIICASLGCKTGIIKSFVYSCNDYYFSAITPSATGGQPAMVYYMAKDGIPISKSCIALLLTLVEYMAVLVLLGIISFFIHMDFLLSNKLIIIMFCIGLVLSSLVIFASLAAMFAKKTVSRLGVWCIRLLAKIHIIKNKDEKLNAFFNQLEEYKNGAEYIKTHPAVTVKVFIICIIQRIMLFSVTYCVYRGMGLDSVSMVKILALQSILMLTVTTLPLPGAVGAAEGMFLVIFKDTFPHELIMPAMMLTRGINFYFCVLFAGTVTLINHLLMLRKNKRKLEHIK